MFYVLIQLPPVQNYAKDKVLTAVSESYEAKWHIENVSIDFFSQLSLEGIHFLDQADDTLLIADKLQIDIGLFSLLKKELQIDAIRLSNASIKLYETKNGKMNYDFLIPESSDSPKDTPTTSSSWQFSLQNVKLDSSSISYSSQGQNIRLYEEDLSISINDLDIEKQTVDVGEIMASGLDLKAVIPSAKEEVTTPFTLPDLGWNVSVQQLQLGKSNIKYSDGQTPINLKKLDLNIKDFIYKNDSIDLSLQNFTTNINDEIILKKTSTKANIYKDILRLQSLNIETTQDRVTLSSLLFDLNKYDLKSTDLELDVKEQTLFKIKPYLPENINLLPGENLEVKSQYLSYSSTLLKSDGLIINYGNSLNIDADINIDGALSDMENAQIEANVNELLVDLPQIYLMLPEISIPDSLKNYQQLSLNGAINGSFQNLNLDSIELKIDKVLSGKVSGNLKNINIPDQLSFDLKIENLIAQVNQLPIPKNESLAIDSLNTLYFDGTLAGNMKDVKINGAILSDLGAVDLDVELLIPENIENLSYDGKINLKQFDLGVFLKNEDLDKISLNTTINGKGINLDNIDSKISGTISDFSFRNYTYDKINLDGTINKSLVDGKLSINDKNIKLNYEGIIQLNTDESLFDFTADIDQLNLFNLGLYENDITLKGKINSKFHIPLNPGKTGQITISDFLISNVDDRFYADTISILAKKSSDSTFIDIKSDFMNLDVDGTYNIRDLPNAFMAWAQEELNLPITDSLLAYNSKSVSIIGNIQTIKPLDVFLHKTLVQAGKINIDTQFDFIEKKANGSIQVDSFFYSNVFSERININLSSENNETKIVVRGKNNSVSSTEIPILNIDNIFKNKKIFTVVEAKDDDTFPRLKFSLDTEFSDSILLVSMNDSVILNKKDWLVNKDNKIAILGSKVFIDNFELTDKNEFLTIQSKGEDGENIDINFKNFDIRQFITLLSSEPSKVEGNIDGKVEVKDIYTDLYFLANLSIENLFYDTTSIGKLSVNAKDNPKTHMLETDIQLKGANNDLFGKGIYNTETQAVDFNLDILKLELMLADPFLSEIINDSEGFLKGNISLKGTTNQPIVNGTMNLNDVSTTIVINNVRYNIKNHDIEFDNSTIDLGKMLIMGEDDNAAILSGKIYHNFMDDFRLDVSINTDEFIFLNTSAQDNPVFFGKVNLDARTQIKGPIELLDVEVVTKTLKNTKITLSPFAGEGYLLEETFLTYGKPEDFENQTNEYLLQLTRQYPFLVNVLLEATKDSDLKFIIDPISGDHIQCKGNGNLKIKIKPDGEQEIYGTYTLTEGYYDFSYGDFVSKKFKVKPGGTIKFNGDPLNSVLDIDAIYSVYTTTYELIKNEISIDESEIATAKKRTDVEVHLSLQGTLDEPTIGLDIQVPNLQSSTLISSIDRKLNKLRDDPNELNSQVFGLLIFDSFMLSNNAVSGFGSLGNNIALSSISNLISSQLNKLASNVIKGVDVSVNVNSYDSKYANEGEGGIVTEVGLQVSKQLFNNRLSLSANGNVDLANGGDTSTPYSSFIGDFVLEYKLTENGRYRLRVFSKTDYDRLLNENTNKNGTSLFFSKSFDSKIND